MWPTRPFGLRRRVALLLSLQPVETAPRARREWGEDAIGELKLTRPARDLLIIKSSLVVSLVSFVFVLFVLVGQREKV